MKFLGRKFHFDINCSCEFFLGNKVSIPLRKKNDFCVRQNACFHAAVCSVFASAGCGAISIKNNNPRKILFKKKQNCISFE